MSEEKTRKNVQQDVEIAVLAKEVEHVNKTMEGFKTEMSDKIKSLTDVIRSFIEIADKKVDRDTYLADKLEQGKAMAEMQTRLGKVETDHRDIQIRQDAVDGDRKKIWGFSQNSISFLISILTLITMGAAVIAIFAK